ncbi:MAG TPA: hypothetical protein VJ063_01335 [Verrucomicrobiae bacterium]|nr:hypothetical protein [Verrucomicrobiae bacterium]
MIGMSAAIAQGVMANTLDVDLWVDLPARQYMRVLNIARRIRRDKDKLHIHQIQEFLRCRGALKRPD